MSNRLRKIPKGIKNSLWSVLDAAIYPVVYLAMVPVMMKGLGIEIFGLWIVLNTLMVTLQLFNLNIGLTTIRKLSAFAAREEHGKASIVFSAIIRIIFILIAFVLLLGIIIALIIPHWNFLGISADAAGNVTACILITSLIAGIKFFDQCFQGVLKAYEQYKHAAMLNIFNRIGLLTINVILALQQAAILDLLIANVLFTIIYLLVHFAVIKRALPEIQFTFSKSKRFTKPIVSYSLYLWLQSVIIVITFQTDRFWVSAYAGLTEVSSYGLAATMFNHIYMIFVAMAGWVLPRISGMIARGYDPEKIYNQVKGLLFGVVVISLLAFYFLSPVLFTYWLGKENYQNIAIYIKAFTAFEFVFAHTIMPFLYLNAAGKEKQATHLVLMFGVVCYLFMIAGLYLTKHPVYMIHGMTLSLCITMPVVNFYVRKYLRTNPAVKEVLVEMLPVYLAIVSLYLPEIWMTTACIPVILFLLYKHYLSSLVHDKIWKQPVRH